MSAAHTPGPWELANGARVYAPGKAGPLLATLAYLPKAPGQEAANARVMAAAPELLRELRLLNLNEQGEQRTNTPAWRVICKAEGRS